MQALRACDLVGGIRQPMRDDLVAELDAARSLGAGGA